METKKLLQNAIETPDGTILISTHRHDFQQHTDKLTGGYFMRDGGTEYVRGAGLNPKEDLTLYSDDDFELIRSKLLRGGRGKDSKGELEWVRLKDINDEWLEALQNYPSSHTEYYIKEKEYRNGN